MEQHTQRGAHNNSIYIYYYIYSKYIYCVYTVYRYYIIKMKLKLNKRIFTYKRIAIIAIIIILLYLTFRILRNQINILGIKHFFGFKEGLIGNSNNSNEISSMVLRDDGPGVTSVKYTKYPDITLRDYIIKSSYNFSPKLFQIPIS